MIAYVQPVNTDMLPFKGARPAGYAIAMQPEQKIIADWMGRVMARKGWSGETWASRAKVSTSTVTRSQGDNYNSITSIRTLDHLARAAGVPSVLDYIAADAPPMLPSVEVVCALTVGMLRAIPESYALEDQASVLARGLVDALSLLMRNPEIVRNQDALRAAGEAVALGHASQGAQA